MALTKLPSTIDNIDPFKMEKSIDSLVRASRLGHLDDALARVDELTEAQQGLKDFHRVFETYPYPGLVVRDDGQVILTNGPADSVFNVTVGQDVDNAGIAPVDSPNLMAALFPLKDNRTVSLQTHFVRALIEKDQRPVSLAVIVLDQQTNQQALFLLFLIDIAWNAQLRAHLNQTFKLTRSEQDIMERFVSGQSLQEIADVKKRSLHTVRTQFYSVLAKFGVATQAELVQEVFKVASFSSESKAMRLQLQHPFRRNVSVLRKGGRCVEVTLVGHSNGRPVVVLGSLGIHAPTPRVEHALHDADLMQVVISQPGVGGTSRQLEGEDFFDCVADDLAAVLSQLGVETAPVIGTASNFRTAIAIANRKPALVSHVVIDVPLLPRRYMRSTKTDGKSLIHKALMVIGLKRAAIRTVAQLFVRSAIATGFSRLLQVVINGYRDPDGVLSDPDVKTSLEEGFRKWVAQGVDASVDDFDRSFMDWEDELSAADVPVTVIEPLVNPVLPPEALSKFVDSFPGKVRYVGISDPRSFFVRVYPKAYVELMEGALRGCISGSAIRNGLIWEQDEELRPAIGRRR